MGISRDSRHKRRATGGKRKSYRKSRKFELGRQPANTKIGAKRVHVVRCRGGIRKFRALRLDTGNFSWGSEAITRKSRVISVVYNASNNELVRTNTLVKGSIIQIDAVPFRQWYEAHYGQPIVHKQSKKSKSESVAASPSETTKEGQMKPSQHPERKTGERHENAAIDHLLEEEFGVGRLYACISSRPGQSGRCDGYILEGKELEFYMKKIRSKKGA